MSKYYVYILTNATNKTLYVGVTNDIYRRTYEHFASKSGFAERYNCTKLVYVEETVSIEDALRREKQLKGWKRSKKEALINSINPQWNNLLNS